MRFAMLMPLALTAFLVFPQARANDEAEAPPAKPNVASGLWDAHAKTFDLDGDGRITWEEYQKVTSGFTFFDADKDGAITKADVEALGAKLTNGMHGSHAAAFLGTPGGGFQQLFGGGSGQDIDGLMRILPLLLSGQGQHGSPFGMGAGPMQGMHGMHGMPPWLRSMGSMFGGHGMQGHPGMWYPGMWGGHGMPPWMGGLQGGCNQPGCRTWSGMQILPHVFSEILGGEHAPAPGAHSEETAETEHPMAGAIVQMIPESMKRLAAFGLIAHGADTSNDQTITKEEWEAAVKAVTKDDGSLDLSKLTAGVGLQGMPFPGGDTALLKTLLDTNGDGKVDASDLDGVFEKADKNDDGKVTQDELMPAGTGGTGFPHGR